MTNLLTQNQVRVRLKNAGAPPYMAKVLSACSMVEGFNKDHPGFSDFDIIGDVELQTDEWGPSLSGFQIRSRLDQWGTGDIRDGKRLPRPFFAVRSAIAICEAQGFEAWSTYNSGAFKAYLPDLYPAPRNVHVVIAGDTLGDIAYDNGTTWQELARVNGLHSPYMINIGQHIKLS